MTETNINAAIDAIGTTAITDAAARQDWAKVEALLKAGADVRSKNTAGINALYYAVAYNKPELAEALYLAGARLDSVNSEFNEIGSASAALHLIADFARLGYNLFYDEKNTLAECCRWMEYKQASGLIDSASVDELTAAISELLRHGRYLPEENLKLVERMVRRGGKINPEQLNATRKPAVFQNPPEYEEAIRKLADSGHLKREDSIEGLNEKLFEAAEKGDLELCKQLIEQGADVSAELCWGEGIPAITTALHLAAFSGNLDLCKYLIEQGADVKAKEGFEETVLHRAAHNGSPELCKYLIEEQCVDVNAKASCGCTALHYAAWNGNLELCKYLIEKQGADTKAVDEEGVTVLQYAADSGSLELCKYLIEEQGADIAATDDFCKTVLQYAAGSGFLMFPVVNHGNLELCKYLIEHGADVQEIEINRDWDKDIREFICNRKKITGKKMIQGPAAQINLLTLQH